MRQFTAVTVSEKMASVTTLDYLKLEAAKGSRSDFDRFMSLVLNAPIAKDERGMNCWTGKSQKLCRST
jgi:hypothetical protein